MAEQSVVLTPVDPPRSEDVRSFAGADLQLEVRVATSLAGAAVHLAIRDGASLLVTITSVGSGSGAVFSLPPQYTSALGVGEFAFEIWTADGTERRILIAESRLFLEAGPDAPARSARLAAADGGEVAFDRVLLTSQAETDSIGSAEVIRATYLRQVNAVVNASKAAFAWYDGDNPAQAVAWVQAHDYLHSYNPKTFAPAAVNVTTNRITLSHGLPGTWRVNVSSTGTLPAPLSAATSYFAKRIDASTLELYTDAALTSIVNLTSQGSGTHTVTPDNNFGNNRHKHISIEVSDSTGAKQTRLSIPYGFDTTEIGVFSANLNVNGGNLRLNGAGNRELQFGATLSSNLTPNLANLRWSIRKDATAESGGNAGSDLRLVPYSDTGVAGTTAMFVKRSTGQVGFGGQTNPAAQVDIGAAGTSSMRVNRAATNNFASIILGTNGNNRWAFQLRNDGTDDFHFRNEQDAVTAILCERRATQANISLLGASKSYGGGVGVLQLAQASAAPTSAPSSGCLIWFDGANLKVWRAGAPAPQTIALG